MSPSDARGHRATQWTPTAAAVGFVVGAWAAGPTTGPRVAASALAVGTVIVAAFAIGARTGHGPWADEPSALLTGALLAWTAIGFGLSGMTFASYESALVTRESEAHVVGIVGSEGNDAAYGAGPVLRVPGGRLQLVAGHAAIREPAGTTIEVVGVRRPLPADTRTRERMRRSRVTGEVVVEKMRVRSPPPWPAVAATTVRRHLRSAAVACGGGDRSALLLGLLIGDDAGMSVETRTSFRRAGLSHLLAVSGANLAVVAAAVGMFVGRLPMRRRARNAVVAVAIAAYVLIVRAEPSVMRAAVTAAVALVAMWRGVERDAVRGFPLVVLAMVVCDPWLVESIGFQLSVAATGGILVGALPLARRLPRRLPDPLRVVVGVTCAAQVAVAPLVAWHFGTIPLIGVVANLPAVPIAEAITLGGAALAPLTVIMPDAFVVLTPLLDSLRWCAALFARVPWADVSIERPAVAAILGCIVVLGAVARLVLRARGRRGTLPR